MRKNAGLRSAGAAFGFGSLVLSDGLPELPYEVQFAPPARTVRWDRRGRLDSFVLPCKPGQRPVDLVVALDRKYSNAIQRGFPFAGILTLMIAPD